MLPDRELAWVVKGAKGEWIGIFRTQDLALDYVWYANYPPLNGSKKRPPEDQCTVQKERITVTAKKYDFV